MITIEKQRNLLVLALAAMIASNLCLSSSVRRDKKMVIMVPSIEEEMVVGTDKVSESYLLYRAEQIMQFLFNIRYENYSYNVEQILKQVSSYNKPEFNKQLEAFIEDVKSKKYFYVFNKDSYSIDIQNLNIIFSGYLEIYINDKKIETTYKQYKLSFENKYGLVKLISFEEVRDGVGDDNSKS